MENMKKYLSEAFGTFVLVFMGCGSAIVLGAQSPGGHLAVAMAFGLAIIATAYTIGGISGCHVNPAVSFAMFLRKQLSAKDFLGYVIGQVAGAIVAAALWKLLTTQFAVTDMTGALGSNAVAGAGGIGGALIVEIVLTCIFLFAILGATSDASNGSVAGIVIGLTLTFVHIVGIPLTGTSVNPARSIGPALLSGGAALKDLWVFIVAPLAGAALAVCLFNALKGKKAKKS
ncbi:MAG: MIP/aquaporin family protein [Christensenellales bacterium]|jgi:aquaporin Z